MRKPWGWKFAHHINPRRPFEKHLLNALDQALKMLPGKE
jgi:hypothetical protein